MSGIDSHDDDTTDEAAFRAKARAFLGARLAPARTGGPVQVMGAGSDDLDEGRTFLEVLGEWAVPIWPAAAGGLGASPALATVLAQELATFDAPDLYPFMVGLSLVGPTVLAHGSEDQQNRWLPSIRTGDEVWCQLFSEPGAGSDMANLACKAVLDGDVWRVTGQKVWSSRAHYSKWGLLLARTDPSVSKHAGITCFAVDMDSEGVEVRPIVQVNGDKHFNEVFLSDVLVPTDNQIGALGAGWKVAMTTLAHERLTIGQTGAMMTVEQVLDLVRRTGKVSDPVVRDRAMRIVIRLEIARYSKLRSRSEARAGKPVGPEGSGTKVWMSDTMKAAADLAMTLLGPAAVAHVDGTDEGEWPMLFLTGPSLSIRGGTDEVMRNILGERVLGLPPEPRVDKDIPFSELGRR